ncbi:hypothetical protein X777_10118, partial [Ooceraea biroi]
ERREGKGERDRERKRKRESEATETKEENRETRQRVRPPSRLHTTSSIPSLHTQLQLHRGRGSLVCTCEIARASLSHNLSRIFRMCVCTYIHTHMYRHISII